jgi:uncharacterized membrane protein
MVDIKEIVGAIFAIFVGIALFMSYEPTRIIIEQIVGTIMTALFIGIVIAIVAGIIYLVVKLKEDNVL